MIGNSPTNAITETVTAIETHRLLLGFLPFPEARNALQGSHQLANPDLLEETSPPTETDESGVEGSEPTATPDGGLSEQVCQEQWMETQQAISPIEDIVLEHPPIEPLPEGDELEAHVEEFRESDAFTQVFADVDDSKWEIGRVPISHLVAFQKSVNTEAYEDIDTWEEDPLAVLEYTLPTESAQMQMQTPIQTPGNALIGQQFISRSPNIQVAGMEMGELEDRPGKIVSFHIKSKPNFVQVARLNGRCILKNGYHRVYQLMQAGETHVPCIIRDVDDYAGTGGANGNHLSPDVVLSDRPPLVTDFESEVAVDIKRPATNKLIRVTAETTNVPR